MNMTLRFVMLETKQLARKLNKVSDSTEMIHLTCENLKKQNPQKAG
jgi:hypothetical protein